jgi:hypothetical protein
MKIICPNIEKGENVHTHYCRVCEGSQHVDVLKALKYELADLLVLTDKPPYVDASDQEMHSRLERYIDQHKRKHKYGYEVAFERVYKGEPISTLQACIATLKLYKSIPPYKP